MEGVGRWGWVQVDCADPELLASFWSAVLGSAIEEPLGDPPVYLGLHPTVPGGPVLSFQRVPEPKAVKDRLHLDVAVDDVDRATARVEELGGKRLPGEDFGEFGFRWRVTADPEGNEFCLVFS